MTTSKSHCEQLFKFMLNYAFAKSVYKLSQIKIEY